MNVTHERDEYLERLWYMKEQDKRSLQELKSVIEGEYAPAIVDALLQDGLVEMDEGHDSITLTQKGEGKARSIVRAHRLAERLLFDVIGRNIEDAACEFEHMVTPELVDSICILLGHPRECPHGLTIPAGECCRASAKVVKSSVKHLTEMEVGQSSRIAYINCAFDGTLHRLNGLHIRPGVIVKLHQKFPTFVVECEGASIALDEEIASNICVWTTPSWKEEKNEEEHKPEGRKKGLFKGLFRNMHKST